MKFARQNGIVRRQENKSAGPGAKRLGQRSPVASVARAHDHQAAARQGTRRFHRIGQPLVVGQKGKQTRVEAGGGSC